MIIESVTLPLANPASWSGNVWARRISQVGGPPENVHLVVIGGSVRNITGNIILAGAVDSLICTVPAGYIPVGGVRFTAFVLEGWPMEDRRKVWPFFISSMSGNISTIVDIPIGLELCFGESQMYISDR